MARNPECIYVAQGENGLLKVGKSIAPRRRASQLMGEFRLRGTSMVRFHACDLLEDAGRAETILIQFVASAIQPFGGREWFVDACFETVVAVAQEITAAIKAEPEQRAEAAVLLETSRAPSREAKWLEAIAQADAACPWWRDPEAWRSVIAQVDERDKETCTDLAEVLLSHARAAPPAAPACAAR